MTDITFLLDKTNNWIEPFVKGFINTYKINKFNFNFKISFNHEKVKNNDIVFILGYTKILNELFLNSNILSLVVHESNLPEGKGFSPIQWQILNGQTEIVFTLFEAKKELDSGDIFFKKNVLFSGYELFDEIRNIQGKKTMELIQEFLDAYPVLNKEAQYGEGTVFKRRKSNDDKLNINKSIKEQFNHFRIANNDDYPLWFEIDSNKYIVKIYREDNEQ